MIANADRKCKECADIVEQPDVPHVVRKCRGCGRALHIREPGKHGIGLTIRDEDTFVIPKGWLRMSLNPLQSRGRLSRYGIGWYAKQMHLEGLTDRKKMGKIKTEIERLEERCDKTFRRSKLLEGLDIDKPEDANEIIERLKRNTDTPEWWTLGVGTFLSLVREAIDCGNTEQAVWAMACAERCRAMAIFKTELEEVVWMGQAAGRVIDLLRIWNANKTNNDEEFWQITFTKNSYAIQQVFAVPVVFIKDKAYVGGMNLEQKKSKLVDYLFALESSREAALVEIKSPTTRLIGRKYRSIFGPSPELSGSVVQALDYRVTLMRNLASLREGTKHDVEALQPRCVVIIGNGQEELTSEEKRKCFEHFRANLRDVEIVTYDELFRKLEVLANVFNLLRREQTGSSAAQDN